MLKKSQIFLILIFPLFFLEPIYGGKVLILSLNPFSQYEDSLGEIDSHSKVLMLPKKKMNVEDFENQKKNYHSIIKIGNYLESAEVELNAFQLYQNFPFEKIVIMDEYDILRAGKLRDLLSLKGQSYESAIAFRDKVRMKTILRKAGMDVPNFAKIKNGADLLDFVKKNGFPFVLKPRRGAGTLGAMIVRDQDSLQNVLLKKGIFNDYHEGKLEAETFIEGEMYHIDGLVVKSKLVACWPSIYTRNSLVLIDGGCEYNFSSHLLPNSNPTVTDLNSYAKTILNTLPTPEDTAFHLEVFRTKEKKIIFCEIAARVGGCGINSTWKESFGVDLITNFIRLQAGLPASDAALNFSFKPSVISGVLLFPKRNGTLTQIPDKCPFSWVKEFKVYSKVGEKLSNPKELADRMAEITLLIASSEDEFQNRLQKASEWFNENTKIE